MQSVAQLFDQAVKYHQMGNLHQAELLYRQILQQDPRHAGALHLLGLIAHQVGRSDLALQYIHEALRLQPAFPTASNNLGNILKEQGKFDEAVTRYRQALRYQPAYPEAHNNLACVLKEQGKLDEAVASYRKAVQLKPDYAEAYSNLGNALRDLGRHAEAAAQCQQALKLKPDFAEAYSNLGNALRDQGKLDEAIASFQQALRLRPNLAEAYNNLGMTLKEQGKLDEAITNYKEALRLKPDFAAACNNLGIVLEAQDRLDEAIASYEQALRYRPEFPEARNNLGNGLQEQGRLDEAVVCYQQALRLKPDFANARWNFGTALQQLGDFAGAERAYREVLHAHPRHADALWQLATLLRDKLPASDRAVIERSLADPGLNDTDRSRLLFGLAQVCDAKGEFDLAAAQLRQANALVLALNRRQGHVYGVEDNVRLVDNIITAFDSAFFERARGFGLATERPVFIVGLPRSGTTLTEQILAAHSQVFGAGELHYAREAFLDVRMKPTEERIFATTPGQQANEIRRLAQRHLDQLSTLNGTAGRIVDKMPDNYLYLGMLAVMFPKAKFIHCRRDLRDVAVSCWMTHFRHLRWANDPEHIAARFRDYQRLMTHWRAVLPISMLEVRYEETVTDFESVARRLVAWCGLDWEPACLAFYEGMRPIRTASATQARQPVYTRSVARWRNYEQDLGALFAGLTPLLEKG